MCGAGRQGVKRIGGQVERGGGGGGSAYARATRCPVLTKRMAVRSYAPYSTEERVCSTTSGTEIA
eukprot:2574695-Rhodomonas_salina.1